MFTFLQNNTLSRADLYPKGIAYNVHYGDVLIKYGEVIDLDVDQAEMIADDVIVKKYLKSKLQNGDLIFADTAEDETVGKTSEIQNIGNRTVISGLHTIPLRPKTEFAFGFLGFLFSSVNFRNELKPLIQGIKVSSISKNALKTLTVKISADVKEQAEISNLLLHLSHAITLHQRKEEELQKLKKGLLQKMFPKDGESVPEIRFPNFTDSWEQRKLNEVISRFIVPMRDKPKSFDGNIPWTRIEDIEGNEISRSLTNQNVSEETVEKMNLRIIPKDSLIVSASATFGVTAFVKANLITNQTFIGLVPNDNIDLGFLYYSFNAPSLRTQMKMESAGSTIFYIPQDRFKEMVISLPNIKEQYKLAKLFSDLDKLITLHHRKTEELKKLKKALLQQMFV